MKSIIEKIKQYDDQHNTCFAGIVAEKVQMAKKNDGLYRKGIVHGLCLALTHLEIITPADAVRILDDEV